MTATGEAEPFPVKPLLRGVSHQIAFFVALAGAAALLLLARGKRALFGAGVYGVCLSALFGVSALYHRLAWAPRARRWMRRLDHSAIFLLIAGTFTPFCLLLDRGRALALSLAWGGAGLGVTQSIFWVRAPRPLVAGTCVALGWMSVPFLGPARIAAGAVGIALLGTGGLLYSLGAAVYAIRRPDPVPAVFGYHEVFHALVIAASGCHFAVIVNVVRALR